MKKQKLLSFYFPTLSPFKKDMKNIFFARKYTLLAFIILIFSLTCVKSYAQNPEGLVPDEVEFQALKALYDKTNGSNWKDKTGWSTGVISTNHNNSNFETWRGVALLNGDVTGIYLRGYNISNSIPLELAQLVGLKNIDLSSNNLSSSIPSNLSQLKNLQSLDLSINQLSGSIPSTLGQLTNLTNLNLFRNSLTGSIPSELGQLINLYDLYLGNNLLTGLIPSSLGQLVKVSTFDLQSNQLTGSIPPTFGQLKGAYSITLGNNQLTGTIPATLGQLKGLTLLHLESNQLSGPIPSELANAGIRFLVLSNNQFTDIPINVPNPNLLPDMGDIKIDNNRLTFGSLENWYWRKTYSPDVNKIFRVIYSPQADIGITRTIEASLGSSLSIPLVTDGLNNLYQWQKKNTQGVWQNINNAIQSSYNVMSVNQSDIGIYRCVVTNTQVPFLTLYSKLTTVTMPVACNADYQWARQTFSTSSNPEIRRINSDDLGNVYSTGNFFGTFDFGLDISGKNVVLTDNEPSPASSASFLTKHNKAGQLIWARKIKNGVPSGSWWKGCFKYECKYIGDSYQVASDNTGNVYVAGFFAGTNSFGVTAANPTGIVKTASIGEDLFVAKFNSDGEILWVQQGKLDQPATILSIGLVVDKSGNVYFHGSPGFHTGGTVKISFKDDINDAFTTTPKGGFLVKYNTDGNVLWLKGNKNNSNTLPGIIKGTVDNTGQLYFAGYTTIGQDYGNGLISSVSQSIVKMDADGNTVWITGLDGGDARFYDIKISPQNEIFATGEFSSSFSYSGNPYALKVKTLNGTVVNTLYSDGPAYDMFLVKYDLNGNLSWSTKGGSHGENGGNGNYGTDFGNSLGFDPLGNVFVTGPFEGLATFGNLTVSANATGGRQNMFLVKYDRATGQPYFVNNVGFTTHPDYYSYAYSYDLASNSSGQDLYIGGYFDQIHFLTDERDETFTSLGASVNSFITKICSKPVPLPVNIEKTITITSPVDNTNFTVGSSLTAGFTTTGTFTGNFILDIFDLNNDKIPIQLGTVASNLKSITATLPSTLLPGKYYIRLRTIDGILSNIVNIVINLIPPDLQKGLLACYPFSGDANDKTGNGNNGINHGATLTTDRLGNANSAYQFDGSSSYVSVDAKNFLNTNYTYTYWAKIDDLLTSSTYYPTLSIGDVGGGNDQTSGYSTNYFGTIGWSGTSYGTDNLPLGSKTGQVAQANQWYNITFTRTNTSCILYINGQKINATPINGISADYGSFPIVKIGGRAGAKQYFRGAIDDLSIYNRAISDEEALKLYTDGIPCPTAPPVSISVSPSPICKGSTTVFTATNIPAGETVTWLVDGSYVGTGNPLTYTATASGSKTVSLLNYSATANLVITDIPTVIMTGARPPTCGNASDGYLKYKLTNATSYTFNNNGVIVNGIGGGDVQFTGLSSGTYKMEAQNGPCKSPLTITDLQASSPTFSDVCVSRLGLKSGAPPFVSFVVNYNNYPDDFYGFVWNVTRNGTVIYTGPLTYGSIAQAKINFDFLTGGEGTATAPIKVGEQFIINVSPLVNCKQAGCTQKIEYCPFTIPIVFNNPNIAVQLLNTSPIYICKGPGSLNQFPVNLITNLKEYCTYKPGDTYSIVVTDAQSNIVGSGKTAIGSVLNLDLQNLSTGTYTVTGSLDNYTGSATATFNVKEISPESVGLSVTTVAAGCAAGENLCIGKAIANITGGYDLNHDVIWQQYNGSSWTNLAVTGNEVSLPSGDCNIKPFVQYQYRLSATFNTGVANGNTCNVLYEFTIPIQPSVDNINLSLQMGCSPVMTADIIFNGQTPQTGNYKINWQYLDVSTNLYQNLFEETVGSFIEKDKYIIRSQYPDAAFKNGTYQVLITDEYGCVKSFQKLLEKSLVARDYGIILNWGSPEITPPPPVPPITQLADLASSQAKYDLFNIVSECVKLQSDGIALTITAQCENIDDVLHFSYPQNTYHYTLYYYNRAGQLTKTIPPAGVKPLDNAITPFLSGRDVVRNFIPSHILPTKYEYNSLGQLVYQNTPDGGTSRFIYNLKGQLLFSQNARQQAGNSIDQNNPAPIGGGVGDPPGDPGDPDQDNTSLSYTNYDELGRVKEVGEAKNNKLVAFTYSPTDSPVSIVPENETLIANLPLGASLPNGQQQTFTVYSDPAKDLHYGNDNTVQRNLQNRVSYTYTINKGETDITKAVYTYYSYDVHGNVEWMVHKIPGLPLMYMAYEYDLISGKVLKVRYNEFSNDRFYHRYSYDEDNRLTKVETSKDDVIWDRDAVYDYYLHGPLKRVEIGEDKIQGLDYVYTIHGWLKGINRPNGIQNDIGNDGAGNGFSTDHFGMNLSYYTGDYKSSPNSFTLNDVITPDHDLFNGNITAWSGYTPIYSDVTGWDYASNAFKFKYDKLNRIKTGDYYNYINSSTGEWKKSPSYSNSYTYDANGNILQLKRNDQDPNGNLIDNLTYTYNWDKDHNLLNNQLKNVTDAVPKPANSTQGDISGSNDYFYDEIGNLVNDAAAGTNIKWNVYGKVSEVIPTASGKPYIRYAYDASGNRILKEVRKTQNALPADITSTYYVRDAQGNVMATYAKNGTEGLKVTERNMFGSDRLGIMKEEAYLNSEDELTFKWKQTGGPNTAKITNDDKPVSDLSGLVKGNYTFNLTTTNKNELLSTVKQVNINVAEIPISKKYLTLGGNTFINFGTKDQYTLGKKDFTAEAWIYVENNKDIYFYPILANQIQVAPDIYTGFVFLIFKNKLALQVSENAVHTVSGVQTVDDIPKGRWVHVAAQKIGRFTKDFKLFVDGVEKGTVDGAGAWASELPTGDISAGGVGDLLIGTRSFKDGFFIGGLKDVRLYNRLLSGAEVNNSFLANDVSTDGLILQAPLNDDAEVNLKDNANFSSGTIIGSNYKWEFDELGISAISQSKLISLPLQKVVLTGFAPQAKIEGCITCEQLKKTYHDFVVANGEPALQNQTLITTYLNNVLGTTYQDSQIKSAVDNCKITEQYLNLTGSTYINFGTKDQYTLFKKDFTTEAWIYVENDKDVYFYPILANQISVATDTYTGFMFGIFKNKLVLQVSENAVHTVAGVQTVDDIPKGRWVHVAAQKIGRFSKDFKLYVDGVEKGIVNDGPGIWGSELPTGDISTGGVGNLLIGTRSFNDGFFVGNVSDVSLYDGLLSPAELMNGYKGIDPVNTDNFLLRVKLNETAGNTVTDYSKYGVQGQIQGTGYSWQSGTDFFGGYLPLTLCDIRPEHNYTYLWTQKEGPGHAIINDKTSLLASAEGLKEGSYTFTLTATDNDGTVKSSDVKVNVAPANGQTDIITDSNDGQIVYGTTAALASTAATSVPYRRSIGLKAYELKDHLGNVRVTVSDQKFDFGDALILSYSNYYPFGMEMPGLSWSLGLYRYGFNGKEKDPEFNGDYDYGLRIYDSRISKFLSVDPLFRDFAWNSPYAFAENDVIRNIDLDGAEKHPYQHLPQWQQNIIEVFDGSKKGLKQLVHDLAPIRPADENDAQTLPEAWDRIKNIPKNIQGIPANLKEVYTNGSLEDRSKVSFEIVGTIFALSKGKPNSTLSGFNAVRAGFNAKTRIVTFLNRVKNIKNEVKLPDGFEKITVNGSKAEVFKLKGKNEFISPDLDSHIGGIWKKALGKAENLFKKETRQGSYNADLSKRLGD